MIETARLNGRDPDAYLRNVVTRIPDHPNSRLENQLPRHSLPICNRYTIGSN
ncbi:transposase domain-containing protein [Agrobacterium tumefaciens]|uniref:transposase domain-containing protein n=1 Tax=Agrobacterium tumefaciens TaxID=358 RepID=UPI0015723CAD|nr:transposase domain-containing protein [Agrobacterium tumefaciens]NSY51277.1 transposase domain-containing protein [Agrobacterium tumefaciens]NTD89006.1 transposase domain-containing protein [Agrobacterium tumefaciens]NTD93462.1 transposase domain-containing protein [Agrobacterium tumefaciens]NTD97427.1 transposase domain-containing protein [Agrobacterium tumefaciens]NTE16692.1 transposase domain-containing protein [Agrobacterium tumefaciens]